MIRDASKQPRLLVAIASYGHKNLPLLRQVIASYREFTIDVHVVVLSEQPKQLGPGIEVIVGLPAKDPWSLPFAHKPLFAERVNEYDLFVYSEDDVLFTERHLRAFVEATPQLQPDEIAGYLRYEVDGSGKRWIPTIHDHFHWKPESVRQRGPYTVAELTNEHSGFYLLTQSQLNTALGSGGFLRAPYQSRYDMLCSAGTDPYTSCGFRKVLCISHMEDFLLHHLSNRYAGTLGMPVESLNQEIETLIDIGRGKHPATTLCQVESRMIGARWSKSFYEPPNDLLIELVPRNAGTILSVGCGSGQTESRLVERGAIVAALPLNSVVGASGATRGVEMVYGDIDHGLTALSSRKFDCVIVSNLLHLFRNPGEVLQRCVRLLAPGGSFIASGPNFDGFKVMAKRFLRIGDYHRLSSFAESGITPCTPRTLKRYLDDEHLSIELVRWFSEDRPTDNLHPDRFPGRLTARNWLFRARRISRFADQPAAETQPPLVSSVNAV
jgi:SAM-dependent methyltransferase